jgi:hypothetical protein
MKSQIVMSRLDLTHAQHMTGQPLTTKTQTMTKGTELKIIGHVSDCFNHREGAGADSAYMRLTKLMIEQYDLTNNDVDEVAGEIEELVAKFIMENSPKLTDND